MVTGVAAPPPGRHVLLRPATLSDRRPGASGTGREVRLGSRQSRRVYLRGEMTDCEFIGPRSATVVSRLTLRYRVLGLLPASTGVALPERLRVASPREESCPRPSAETRSPG